MTSARRVAWPWSGWSLARRLPLLTAAIVVLVVALSLTLTYSALSQARSEALHDRLGTLAEQLAVSSEESSQLRVAALREVAADSAVQRVLQNGRPTTDAAVLATLGKLAVPADSGLPIELWTADGRRVARIGQDVRGDSLALLPPELRPLHGGAPSELPATGAAADSVQFGTLYQSGGRVYYWVTAPVNRNGARIGFITQQRRIYTTPQALKMVQAIIGDETEISIRNVNDGFMSSLLGTPMTVPPRDTAADGFTSRPLRGEPRTGAEARVGTYPWLIVLEVPVSSVLSGPRATLRRIGMLSLFLIVGGVLAVWVLSRQITRPLVELTVAVEAIAQGNYGRRVATQPGTRDEVSRLGESFNRMAGEVEASQHELASQVEQARGVSEQLERTNAELQRTSAVADEARDTAMHANRAKSDFLAVMSHELRTPLNAIGGYTEILDMGLYGEINEKQRDALARIARSQQALLSLINDVLNFAKLEAGEVQYAISAVPLLPMFEALEPMIAPQLRDRRLSYCVAPCDAALRVQADPDKLQQVLLNLLSNAIKYTPEGGTVELLCEAPANEPTVVEVMVRDTGIGIAEDRLDKVFDPFIQVGRALNRPHEGVGLGLSISRDLAAGMGATLSVESVVDEGSTFTVSLRRAPNG